MDLSQFARIDDYCNFLRREEFDGRDISLVIFNAGAAINELFEDFTNE